jgi:hypothetical protein
MQNECQSGTGRRFVATHLQIVGDIERSILQESSKLMKLKGFRYIAGYCLSSKACIQLQKEKIFIFWQPESWLEGKVFFVLSRSSV